MAHQHKSRQQRAKYKERFLQRYGMNQQDFRELQITDPQKAHARENMWLVAHYY